MLKIVRASSRDIDELAHLSKQSFDNDIHYGAPAPGGPPGYDSAAWQSKMMRIGEYYKIILDSQMIGGVIVFRKRVREYEVGRIFISCEHQNQGIGKRVFEFLWEAYPLAKKWTLGTPTWNARTRHFYKKVGFEELGEDGRGGVLFECYRGVMKS
jgi:RimJ/RimL family protein N-acetyltransferase